MRRLLALLSLCFLGCAASTSADDGTAAQSADITSSSIANFVKVRPGLYRGGHPDAAGLDYLKSIGVERIVDLEVADFIEATPWSISDELDGASARGLTEIRYPMSAFEPAVSKTFDANMTSLLAVLATATPAHPVYVHCKHGQDRTGLVIGLERVEGEGWTPADAHAEMLNLGFHTYFLGLEEYFENRTGFED